MFMEFFIYVNYILLFIQIQLLFMEKCILLK